MRKNWLLTCTSLMETTNAKGKQNSSRGSRSKKSEHSDGIAPSHGRQPAKKPSGKCKSDEKCPHKDTPKKAASKSVQKTLQFTTPEKPIPPRTTPQKQLAKQAKQRSEGERSDPGRGRKRPYAKSHQDDRARPKRVSVRSRGNCQFIDEDCEAEGEDDGDDAESMEGEDVYGPTDEESLSGSDDGVRGSDQVPETDSGEDDEDHEASPQPNQVPDGTGEPEGRIFKYGSSFCVNSKWLLLTYPQCGDLSPSQVVDKLKTMRQVDKAVVVREFHKSHRFFRRHAGISRRIGIEVGSDQQEEETEASHIHALVGTCLLGRRGMRVKTCKTFDVGGYHCNIQQVYIGTEGNVLDYITKYELILSANDIALMRMYGYDLQTLNVDWPEGRVLFNRRGANQTKVTDELQYFIDCYDKGQSVAEMAMVNESIKPWIFKNSQKINAYIRLIPKQENKPKLLPWPILTATDEAKYHNFQIIQWLVENVRQPRVLRQKQLWIQGPPGIGKSTLKQFITKRLWTYLPPPETFDNLFHNSYEMIILDEYTGRGKDCNWLKEMADGSLMTLKKKNSSPITKTVNMPFIVLSNYTPSDLPHITLDFTEIKALRDRFLIVRCKSYLSDRFI